MLAARLLAQARTLYDDPSLPFAHTARHEGWQTGFASGAAWMRLVLSHLRGVPITPTQTPFNFLGIFKYGLASLGAIACLLLAFTLQGWWLLPFVVLTFYAIEATMVFLFPLAIDGCPDALRASPMWTQRAGGIVRVMGVVMQFAVVMLFGGFTGGGFVRSWALGCLAVVLWYEEVRLAHNRLP